MKCSLDLQSDRTFMSELGRKAAQSRIPISGSIELTAACNLRCVHCYIAGPEPVSQKDLDSRYLYKMLDDLYEAGCLYLLFTGGEPLLRKDFAEIYTYAKKKGFIITVFSNGTLIGDGVVELFREMPPFSVEISLYGATEETYERIAGVRGSYAACLNGINRLIDAGIELKLKTILMTHNQSGFSAIEGIAKKLGVPFRFDAGIIPRFNGDKAPLGLRVPAKRVVEMEFSDPQREKTWEQFWDRIVNPKGDNYLYSCGAGLTTFHINALGMLQPCLMTTDCHYDLKTGDFKTGWDQMAGIRTIEKKADSKCAGCDKIALCGYCPPLFKLENGSEGSSSDYFCKTGHCRYRRLTGD